MKTKILKECLLTLKADYWRKFIDLQKAKEESQPEEVKEFDLRKAGFDLSGLYYLKNYLDKLLNKTHQENINLKDFFLSTEAQKVIKHYVNNAINTQHSALLKWLTIDNKLSNDFIKQLNSIPAGKLNTKTYFKALKAAQVDYLTNYFNNFNKRVYRYCAKVEPNEDTYIEDLKKKLEESII